MKQLWNGFVGVFTFVFTVVYSLFALVGAAIMLVLEGVMMFVSCGTLLLFALPFILLLAFLAR